MIESKSSYVYGSAARKLEYDVYEENSLLKSKRNNKKNKKSKLQLTMYIAIIATFSLLVMYRYTVITDLGYQIKALESQYQSIKEDNNTLRVQIEKSLELSTIKEIAKTRLGMDVPHKHQIVYVNVPRSDFIYVSEEVINERETFATLEKGKNSNRAEGWFTHFISLFLRR